MAQSDSVVYELDPGERVSCYFCMQSQSGLVRGKKYKRGEAYLCGPDHSPCDANANYVCEAHLDKDVVKIDMHTKWKEYKEQRKKQKKLSSLLRRWGKKRK